MTAAAVGHVTSGLRAAWADMHDRRQGISYDNEPRNKTGIGYAPNRHPETAARYHAAQRVIRTAHDHAGLHMWPWADPTRLVIPERLIAIIDAAIRVCGSDDPKILELLAHAEKTLRPWWRTPRQPKPRRTCRTCRARYAAPDRRQCWVCIGKHRPDRKRTRRVTT